jgi:hypothetical protein
MIALKITLTYQLPNYCRKNENTQTCLDVDTFKILGKLDSSRLTPS